MAEDRTAEEQLATNRRIGAAMGLPTTRHGITEDAALERPRHASRSTQRTLRDVAGEVALTGELG